MMSYDIVGLFQISSGVTQILLVENRFKCRMTAAEKTEIVFLQRGLFSTQISFDAAIRYLQRQMSRTTCRLFD